MTGELIRNPGSFRDPGGFVFTRDGVVYRHLADSAREDYQHLNTSGLYAELVGAGLLVDHEEVAEPDSLSPGAWKVLCPRRVPFISWPYEWSFSQLKAAALLTLDIARRALAKGMILKDASAYNVQFIGSRPIFIDTLSLSRWEEGAPWMGYRQFCGHFLAPLALAAHCDARYLAMQRQFLDGIPLDFTARALPWRTKLNPGLLAHLHVHAKYQQKHADNARAERTHSKSSAMSKRGLAGILDNLAGCIAALSPKRIESAWADYYDDTNYSNDAMAEKKRLVASFLAEANPGIVWDLGANTGAFSAVAAEENPNRLVVAMEADEAAADRHFVQLAENDDQQVASLVMDLANPSPAMGWNESERAGMTERGPADCVMALALVHHLAIGNNVPLEHIADAFARWAKWAIVEFVPKEDSQTKRLLASREDIFPNYTQDGFRRAFEEHFVVVARKPIGETARTLFLMKRRA